MLIASKIKLAQKMDLEKQKLLNQYKIKSTIHEDSDEEPLVQ